MMANKKLIQDKVTHIKIMLDGLWDMKDEQDKIHC